ncbi:hypothetical protein HMPREF0373_00256 [Eubacterium ramulus ATCC 29099]|uniref:Uncharacterized protein n=1 Tax=Eubacterium ramulus ATCC 29099 TaxID=1256908 RepID=U2RED7_EUBRA|nr:hypothetical protein HMPREF0373_00256 [Eubacterium ramulus ATCC 29099]
MYTAARIKNDDMVMKQSHLFLAISEPFLTIIISFFIFQSLLFFPAF